jgi:hypothetical protein
MNYKKIYDAIIENRTINQFVGYTEKHHIIPRSLDGVDDSYNIIALSSREHFVCHFLLSKMYAEYSVEWYKMNHAFMIMKAASTQTRYVNSRLYEYRRRNFSKVMSHAQKGDKNSQYGTRWIYNTTVQISKKIPKNEILPNGWNEGRKLKWNKSICTKCGEAFQPKTKAKYCSDTCRLAAKRQPTYIGREDEFLLLYIKYNNMDKALKEMGYIGAVAHWHKWARNILDNDL